MIVMGLNQGMQPIAGYNFGAQNYHRVNQVMKYTVIAATIVTTSGFLVGELMPELAVAAFTHRFTAHPAKCQRPAGSGHVLPYHRLPDGYF